MARKESPVANRRIGGGLFERTDTRELTADEEAPKVKRTKRTFHLEPEVVLLLDELQLEEHRRTGQKPELSNLVSQAIRLLGESRQQAGKESEHRAS